MLTKDKISGVGTALVTPFDKDGGVDYPALEKIVEYSIASGVDFLVLMGTTGESPTVTPEEKSDICRWVVRCTSGRVPLVIGIGGNNTAGVISQIQHTDLSNFTHILSVAPYYNRPSQAGLYAHYKAIAEASPLPVIIYNIPKRCGVNVEPETVLKLARDCPNIVALKAASGNVEAISEIIKNRPEGFSVLSGDDALTLTLMAKGADGVISTSANIFPQEMAALTRAAYKHDWTTARAVYDKISAAVAMLFEEGNPSGVKAALHIKGYCENILRLPLVPVSDDLYERMKQIL